jgi:hypothetical protein
MLSISHLDFRADTDWLSKAVSFGDAQMLFLFFATAHCDLPKIVVKMVASDHW